MARRRGAELERALLDAACDELAENGYARFTVDAVAARAGTSTPVLYRRWSNKRDLLLAAITHTARRVKLEIPDTGALRGDVLALMRQFSDPDATLLTMVSVHLGPYFQETGTSPVELLALLAPELPLIGAVDTIYRRAADRGETDPDRVTARIRTLPFDLLRNELMMTLRPVSEGFLEEIVDSILLPLVQSR
jgi:AcrR family transcriptional regulator